MSIRRISTGTVRMVESMYPELDEPSRKYVFDKIVVDRWNVTATLRADYASTRFLTPRSGHVNWTGLAFLWRRLT